MSSLTYLFTVLGVLFLALLAGQLLYYRYYNESRGVESLLRMVLNAVWILSGAFLIARGDYVPGAVVVAIGWWFWLSNRRRVHESDLATDTVRSSLANFMPSNGRRR